MRYLYLIKIILLSTPLMTVSACTEPATHVAEKLNIAVGLEMGKGIEVKHYELRIMPGITISRFKEVFWELEMPTHFPGDKSKPISELMEVYYGNFPLPNVVTIDESATFVIRPHSV